MNRKWNTQKINEGSEKDIRKKGIRFLVERINPFDKAYNPFDKENL